MTFFMNDAIAMVENRYFAIEDIKNLSHVNRGLYNYISNPSVAERIWKPLVPSFPAATSFCETKADIVQRENKYFLKTVEFKSLNGRCVAKLSFQEIEPECLVRTPYERYSMDIDVKEGQSVKPQDTLFTFENGSHWTFMVRAAIAGTIQKIFVTEKMHVQKDDILALLKKEPSLARKDSE